MGAPPPKTGHAWVHAAVCWGFKRSLPWGGSHRIWDAMLSHLVTTWPFTTHPRKVEKIITCSGPHRFISSTSQGEFTQVDSSIMMPRYGSWATHELSHLHMNCASVHQSWHFQSCQESEGHQRTSLYRATKVTILYPLLYYQIASTSAVRIQWWTRHRQSSQ